MTPASAEKMLRRYDSAFRVLKGLTPKAFRALRRGWQLSEKAKLSYVTIWRHSPETGNLRHLRTIQDAKGFPRDFTERDLVDLIPCHAVREVLKGKGAHELSEHEWAQWEWLTGDEARHHVYQKSAKDAAERKAYRKKEFWPHVLRAKRHALRSR